MMKTLPAIRMRGWINTLAVAVLALPLAGYSITVTQTVNSANSSTDWNTALWGAGPDVPTSGNDYVTAAGLGSSGTTRIGSPDVSGRVRDYVGSTFLGDSLTIVSNTEFLLKQTGNDTSTANIILDGGVIRLSAGSSAQGTVTGTVHVAAESWVGVADLGTPILTIASTITGTNVLHVASGLGDVGSGTIRFVGDLSGFTGTLELGGGDVAGTLEFGQAYNLSNTVFSLKSGASDYINLTTNITFLALNNGTNSLPIGTYTAEEINDAYIGNGIQFIGTNGTLTVLTAPYPAPQPPPNTNIVIQVANAGSSDSWNGPTIWGAQTTVSNKDYFSSSSLYGSGQANQVNYGSILGRIRALDVDTNFNGNSLTLVDDTELLVKSVAGVTNRCDDLIIEGALIRYSPNSASSAALAGNLTVTTNSVIGIEQTGASIYTVASALHGAGDLSLRSGRTTHTLAISGDLSDYTGDLLVEGGTTTLILDLNQNYDLPDVDLVIEDHTNRVHVLQLDDQTIKLKTFTFGSNTLATGTAYTADQLDAFFGTTNRFTGATGTLEVYESGAVIPTIAPDIESFSIAGGTVSLQWMSEVDVTYSILHKTNLADSVWTPVKTNIVAVSTNTSDAVSASGADTEFFRIIGE